MYIDKKTAIGIFIFFVVVTVSYILYNLHHTKNIQIELSKQKLIQEAIAHFDNMVVTRSWNSRYGGVYVLQQKGLQPNPYLKNNSMRGANNELLVKINPAWMTRQISELSNQRSKYYYKITSLKPINPNNKADSFETEALNYFENHQDDKYYYRFSDDYNDFNFMGALVVKKSCLTCHADQGYEVGDIRGGIRVSIPTILFQEGVLLLSQKTLHNSIIVVLIACLITWLVIWFINLIYTRQEKIEHLNLTLEDKVRDRTQTLEVMYQHEKYIKEILKTISDVNVLLLTSLSLKTMLKNSTQRLAEHKHYRVIWIGLLNQDILEVAYKSNQDLELVDQDFYDLNQNDTPKSNYAMQAIKNRATIISEYKNGHANEQGRRKTDFDIHWVAAIPLTISNTDTPLGVLNVYSDREAGFEPEEINVLERLSIDIALVLHSHEQQNVLKEMEYEKASNYEETILAFVNIIEQRDTYTAGHTIRVAEYCRQIAEAMNIPADEINKLVKAAILHDIGKVATPDSILLKPSKLNALEYELIKQHAQAGYNMLSKIDMYKDLAEIIKFHHSRYDGKGYPRTQSANEIPFLSHIMIVADAFDAMTTNRIYKPRKSIAEALAEIEHLSSRQFHPEVAKVAIAVLSTTQIEETAQTPSTQLEEKRFSYFFRDSLTELYNENYLQVNLSDAKRKNKHMVLVLLKNFSKYNNDNGWNAGNQLLMQVGQNLEALYSGAMVFRCHGDDFVILASNEPNISSDTINQQMPLKETEVYVVLESHVLKSEAYDLEKILRL